MNKEQLEKMFDERFGIAESYERIKDDIFMEDIKQFIFSTIIPEVLKNTLLYSDIVGNNPYENSYNTIVKINNNYVDYLKQRVKNLYNIDL